MTTPPDGSYPQEGFGPAPTPPQEGFGPAPEKPAKKRRPVLIASIVLAVVVLLCGGGGLAAFLLLRSVESGTGAPEPAQAVDSFLTAVYADQDTREVAQYVCSDSRDSEDIDAKIQEVKGYASAYEDPKFDWTVPQVSDQNEETATVTTTVTLVTADEKTADQALTFTVVENNGWWVCEVKG
ncbi:Rv0361 family membrane protein [Catenuloplanes indicus]|uniref:Flagellar basal body-associated protein FliL n=1 Tax=Catenuloplanes indicus TaxID=137267 RepID=A0AAE3W3H1_9ACTN|nr:hypothetical protein [Catenuloplanes indicus]MDQ0368009.1 flagellar basal body-associated protein FliL [Catenuloplanes indicus]